MAWGVLSDYGEQAKSGAIPLEEAKKMAAARLGKLRYEEKEYIWINDLHPRMVMHPYKPELNGTDLSENKDPSGKLLFVEFVKICRENGGGFVNYLWPKPGASAPVQKISYVKLYEPWGWIVGSGIYVDDVYTQVATIRWTLLGGLIAFAAFIIIISVIISRQMTVPVRQMVKMADDLAHGEGDLTKRLGLDHKDEVGEAAGLIDQFIAKVQDSVAQSVCSSNETAVASQELSHIVTNLSGILQQQSAVIDECNLLTQDVAGNLDVTEEMAISTTETIEATRKTLSLFVEELNRAGTIIINESDSQAAMATRTKQLIQLMQQIISLAEQNNSVASEVGGVAAGLAEKSENLRGVLAKFKV